MSLKKTLENTTELKLENSEKFKRTRYGIPKMFHNAKLSDFNNVGGFMDYIKEPKGFLYICGSCGAGKSHLVHAYAVELREKHIDKTINSSYNPLFVETYNATEIFLRLRDSFGNKESSEMDIINKCTKNYAVFDDVGSQKISDYVIEAWYHIIDTRYNECIPTIFTSNLGINEIYSCMGERIASRLFSGKVFKLSGKDRRIEK